MTEPASSLLGAPRGMRDFYPEEMRLREHIFDTWRRTAATFGFEPYDAPVVESLDLLKRKSGEEIVNQIYAFQDKSGRDLALRPEMTPSLARMVAARQGGLRFPLRWSAIAQCFRYERMTRGRKREHYQWNLDIIGEPGVGAETEILACAASALKSLGLGPEDIRIHYSSRKLLAEVFAAAGIAPDHHAATFLALDKRGKISDEEITTLLSAAGLATPQVDAVLQLMTIATLDDVAERIGTASPAWAEIADFESRLGAYGLRDSVTFDIGVVRGLSYYTGIVFEGFDRNRQFRAIFGGGRYDNLLRDVGGRPETGVGLGFGDVVIAEILRETGKAEPHTDSLLVAVGYMTDAEQSAAIRLAGALREADRPTELALRPEKARQFFGRIGGGGYGYAAYIGPDDVQSGIARIKHLATRAEQQIQLTPAPPAAAS